MTDLDTKTELYDLFGETGTCTICQEDLAEGERVRTIRSCQHMFHSTCVDPWLTQKGTCPLCRTPLVTTTPTQEARRPIQDVYNTLRNTIQIFSRNGIETNSIETILGEIGALLAPAPAPAPAPIPLERIALSYCLCNGIWRRYRTAAHYDPQRTAIQDGLALFHLGELRPLEMNTTTFTNLLRACDTFRDKFIQRTNNTYSRRNYTSSYHIQNMKQRLIAAAAAGNTFLSEHWRA